MIPYKDRSDKELLYLTQNGDGAAFEAIYRRHARALFRYARKNIPVKEDCEELVQDVFESLWARRRTLKVESVDRYLLKSIRYMIIRYFRRKGVQARYFEHYRIFAAMYDTDNQDINSEVRRSILTQGLEGLPERCKMAVKLRITDNLSNQEIAERMNISKRTVELYISRALCHLRASFPLLGQAT